MLQFILIIILTFFAMEIFAYFAHKYLFHGVLWFLHRSHHELRSGVWEWNDVFAPFFACIAILGMGGWLAPELRWLTFPIGTGMTIYGGVYFFIHDMFTHRRFGVLNFKNSKLLKLRSAHRHHHANVSHAGQEPFGFVWYGDVKRGAPRGSASEPAETIRGDNESSAKSATKSVLRNSALALAIGMAALVGTRCASISRQILSEPKVTFSSVGIRDFNQDGATILFGILVENPNPLALYVDTLKYDVEIGGKLISSSHIEKAASVPAHGKAVVELPVPVKFSDLFQSLSDLFGNGTTSYHLKGEAKVAVFTLPFDQSGKIKIR